MTQYIDVTSYTPGNGTSDDTSGIIAAEAAAFSAGKILLFPSGKTFLFNGSFTCRVSIEGYGATLKQTNTTLNGAGSSATIYTIFRTGLVFRGLTINSNNKRIGHDIEGCSDILCQDMVVLNAVGLGFGNYGNTNVVYERCRVISCIYAFTTFPQPGGAADGFYFGGCLRCKCIDCYAENFRRIAFVSEGNGGTNSDFTTFIRCWAKNANNSDQSTTEVNAAFWFEHTNNGAAIDCTGENISSGIGQTAHRVEGFVVAGSQLANGTIQLERCRIIGNAVRLPDTLYALEPDMGHVSCNNSYGDFGNVGVLSAASGTGTVTTSNNTMNNVTTPTSP